ncbi:peptide ABC transporter permease [Sphaerisporangium krabiense]|uniref:ABC-type dipeptide/oligopeptide/nickel transport system permease subunit n=1 Tax=Sphaerisporangium krabiense TaxID=763782 RepID=A0A7W9DTM9_9ACTN|nr:ABC transporter permease [Sphaerisporangium krabiense]MBB5629590.1 ABC-type dipeptide/oligopeptide/nickel transport system permease subunit [Sphaerisporangium krabiense]GII67248.1 peptide ABC transporter permease [Sphaerisporangium krabiense]
MADLKAAPDTAALGRRPPREVRGSLWYDAWLDLRRRVLFWVSAAILLLACAMAAFPALFARLGPNERCDLRMSKKGPGPHALFGYDLQGCDYWSQIVHGTRASVLIGLAVTVFALLIAVVLGLVGGYYGGVFDALISRVTDVFFGIPFVLGATVVLVAFPGHGIWAMTLVLVLLGWTTMTRLMRAQVIAVRDSDYVQAARALGASDRRIMLKHILPNAVAPVFVVAMLNIGNVISGEATLDYLGVGLQYPDVSWGLQLNVAQTFFSEHPHLLVFPALFLTATVLSFLMLGDVVRDALDPKLR